MTEVAVCAFCSAQKNAQLYVCPKCQLKYCSLTCYRDEKHQQCSEQFYRQCVQSELSGKRTDRPLNMDDLARMTADADEDGDPLEDCDSDDQGENISEQEYIARIVSDAKEQLADAEEGDLDRKLTTLGVGTESDSLLAALTPSERLQFQQLLEELDTEESGLAQSVFSKR